MSEIIQFEFEASVDCTVPFQDRSKHAKQFRKLGLYQSVLKNFKI